MNRRAFIGSAAAFAYTGVKPVFAGDTAALAAAKKWFKEARFGMMAHWGLYPPITDMCLTGVDSRHGS